tara:strand:+ start:430 stop:654 length:225 start_codon:yes stop_codon:yes gene_type:complete
VIKSPSFFEASYKYSSLYFFGAIIKSDEFAVIWPNPEDTSANIFLNLAYLAKRIAFSKKYHTLLIFCILEFSNS